jgi:Ser/Thr protein kinase RdoA (MazF antagonist)
MSLLELSEEEQVARLRRLAQRSLAAWGEAGASVDLIKYRENAVFRVVTENGQKSVLRIHRPNYRSNDHIRSEVAWMRSLAESDVPTPDVLPTTSGDVLTVLGSDELDQPRQCDRIAWVEGEPLGSLEHGVDLEERALRQTYEVVGDLAARLNEHASSWTKPASFVRPSWDIAALIGPNPTFGRFWELDVLTHEQREILLRAKETVHDRLVGLGPPSQLIHGDLIPDNVLTDSMHLRIIDFDDCGWSWCAFELATSVFPLLVSGGFETGLAAYLSGYRRRRVFPDHELALLPELLVARALSYLGWPVGRPEIHSQRQLAPLFAAVITDLAERYLAGGLRSA